jgi:hypothetical protein
MLRRGAGREAGRAGAPLAALGTGSAACRATAQSGARGPGSMGPAAPPGRRESEGKGRRRRRRRKGRRPLCSLKQVLHRDGYARQGPALGARQVEPEDERVCGVPRAERCAARSSGARLAKRCAAGGGRARPLGRSLVGIRTAVYAANEGSWFSAARTHMPNAPAAAGTIARLLRTMVQEDPRSRLCKDTLRGARRSCMITRARSMWARLPYD